jgi:uncharacterized protein YbbC (DUF1343 family)
MKAINLQLRKMNLIEYLLGVQDEKVFAKIESTIHKSIKSIKPNDIVFTKKDLIERSEFSNNQIKKDLVLTQKELEQQSKNW